MTVDKKQEIDRLYKRLPENYRIPIRFFVNTEAMLREIARTHYFDNYEACYGHYQNYIDNAKTNTYLKKTKYYKSRSSLKTPLDFNGFSGNPIFLSERVLTFSVPELYFIVLHEIGHSALNIYNERKADLFASRWIRKLKKEGFIK